MSDGIAQPTPAPLRHNYDVPEPLAGRALRLARIGWWVIAGLVLVMTALAIPLNLALLRAVCPDATCHDQRLTPAQLQGLSALGISLDNYTAYVVLVNLLPAVIYVGVAFLLFMRKPNDRMAYFTSLTLLIFGSVTNFDFVQQLATADSFWVIPFVVLKYLGTLCLITFFYVFPTGRFVPPWMRFLLVFWVAEEMFDVISSPPLNLHLSPEWLANGAFILILLTSLYAQVYRYRRVSSSFQRQQTKWVVFAIVISLSTLLLSGLIFYSGLVSQEHVAAILILNTLMTLAIVFIPVSIGIAILRSHLYDIDLLINRSLVYGVVTAILAGIFAATSGVMEKVFLAVTGQQSDLATVLSTLVVVASFEPIKKRVQKIADARLKYPLHRFGEFGAKLREFVELSDPHALLTKFLVEALDTFDAQTGAVYLARGAELELVQRVGAGDARMGLSIPLEHNGQQVGLITLGARKNGDPYADADRHSLEQMGNLVAHTIQVAKVAG